MSIFLAVIYTLFAIIALAGMLYFGYQAYLDGNKSMEEGYGFVPLVIGSGVCFVGVMLFSATAWALKGF